MKKFQNRMFLVFAAWVTCWIRDYFVLLVINIWSKKQKHQNEDVYSEEEIKLNSKVWWRKSKP